MPLFKEKKPKKVSKESFFTAKIRKSNRQTLEFVIRQSKKFRVDKDTYFIRPNCIINEMKDGRLHSVSYYTEGNPNPHDFRTVNKGLTPTEFDELYGEDLYEILVELQKDTKTMYLLVLYVMVLAMSFITLATAFIR